MQRESLSRILVQVGSLRYHRYTAFKVAVPLRAVHSAYHSSQACHLLTHSAVSAASSDAAGNGRPGRKSQAACVKQCGSRSLDDASISA